MNTVFFFRIIAFCVIRSIFYAFLFFQLLPLYRNIIRFCVTKSDLSNTVSLLKHKVTACHFHELLL